MPMLASAFLFVPVAMVACVASVRWAWRRRDGLLLWPAVLALALNAFLFWGGNNQAHYWDGWDLNASPSEEDLVGTWRCPNGWIAMHADRSFATGSGRHGEWGFNEYGVVAAGPFWWRTLAHHGELVLLPTKKECVTELAACSDADTWDKWSVCRRDR